MGATKVHYGMIDRSGERTGVDVYFEQLDATNYAELFADTTGNYDVLKVPLILLTQLNLTKSSASIIVDESVESLPTAHGAQREAAIRVIYQDTTTLKKYRFDIPGPADISMQTGTDEIDIVNNVLFAGFKAVFDVAARSPDGNGVEIIRAYFVGRNN